MSSSSTHRSPLEGEQAKQGRQPEVEWWGVLTRRLYLSAGAIASLIVVAVTAFLVTAQDSTLSADIDPPQLGVPISESQLHQFDLIVDESGTTLPPGRGDARQGRAIYQQRCQSCHGTEGEGTIPNTRLSGGDMGSTEPPIRTVGSFWPHATTLFDYVRRAMPADAPKSLSDEEVYQVTAFVLFLNGIIEEDTVLNAETLPRIDMPNANGFIDRSTVH